MDDDAEMKRLQEFYEERKHAVILAGGTEFEASAMSDVDSAMFEVAQAAKQHFRTSGTLEEWIEAGQCAGAMCSNCEPDPEHTAMTEYRLWRQSMVIRRLLDLAFAGVPKRKGGKWPVSQASDPHELRPVCSGKQRHLPYRSSHEWPPTSQTTDAKDKAALVKWSCGRSQISLYNGRRPHSSHDGTTPDQAYFTSLPFRLTA
jgi:hypothetical protein